MSESFDLWFELIRAIRILGVVLLVSVISGSLYAVGCKWADTIEAKRVTRLEALRGLVANGQTEPSRPPATRGEVIDISQAGARERRRHSQRLSS